MQIYRCGGRLHGPNAFSLCTMNGRTLLSSNMLGSHPVYSLRVNQSATYNNQHKTMLRNFIVNSVRNHASEDTIRKLDGMIRNIYEARNVVQKGYKANYNRKFAAIQAALTRLRAERRNREQRHQPLGNLSNRIRNAEAQYTANTNQWVRHQAQLKYWRWIRDVVLPEAKRSIRNLK